MEQISKLPYRGRIVRDPRVGVRGRVEVARVSLEGMIGPITDIAGIAVRQDRTLGEKPLRADPGRGIFAGRMAAAGDAVRTA